MAVKVLRTKCFPVLLSAIISFLKFSPSFGTLHGEGDPMPILEMHQSGSLDDRLRIYEGDVWQPLEPMSKCQDLRQNCADWAEAGECDKDPRYMLPHCPVSCNVCDSRRRKVQYSETFSIDPIIRDRIFSAVGRAIGVPQRIVNKSYESRIIQLVDEAIEYVEDVINVEDRYKTVRNLCRNHDDQCAYWAVNGECESNEEFMIETCAPVCFACEQLHVEARCPIDPYEKQAWYPGDLNKMFEKIISDPYYQKYEIKVLSRPYYADGDNEDSTVDYQIGPWVVILDNFTSSDEANRLIELGRKAGYERSTDVGGFLEDGSVDGEESEGRTSTNAWCNEDECLDDATVNEIYERVENLTQIPMDNYEYFQLLRYEVGQFYEVHHDYIDHEINRKQGPRILTLFMYLNEVEEGGETDFPKLKIAVKPKLGRAVLWPSVFNDQPTVKDLRTLHQAKPVKRGIKYGANVWFHQKSLPDECL